MRLAKAHGLGNDFLLLESDLGRGDAADLARRLCERHRGVGADGLLLYAGQGGGLAMRLLNADGSDAEMSGNGLRCLAAYAFRSGRIAARARVGTAAGPREVEVTPLGDARFRVATDLGPPVLDSRRIPMQIEPPREAVIEHPLQAADRELRVTVSSLGNPHCAVFLDAAASDALIRELGPALERHPAFPNRTNVELVTVLARDALRVRFWERGVGPTSASGTGAASAAVAAILTGRADRKLRVVCDGGVLDVWWPAGGGVRQEGEVEVLLEAEWLAGW